jgi:hypothetical protein
MSKRFIAAALAAVFASAIAACAADRQTNAPSTGTTLTSPDASGTQLPSGATMGSGGGTTGPNEKEDQRGNTPPGKSRDGAGPAAGAILDPTGAATGNR